MLARRIASVTLVVAGALTTSAAIAQSSGSNPAPKGEEVFKRACAACHTAVQTPPPQLGPLGPPPGGLQARAVPPERL
jgi:cytochrome c2